MGQIITVKNERTKLNVQGELVKTFGDNDVKALGDSGVKLLLGEGILSSFSRSFLPYLAQGFDTGEQVRKKEARNIVISAKKNEEFLLIKTETGTSLSFSFPSSLYLMRTRIGWSTRLSG